MKKGSKVITTKQINLDDDIIPKGIKGIVIGYPSWRNDMIKIDFTYPHLSAIVFKDEIKGV